MDFGPAAPAPAEESEPRRERSPVSWGLAEQVAARVAGREPLADSYHYASLQPDFDELVPEAEALVEAETGLRSGAGPARARVTDRSGWVHANVASFQRLLRPVTDRLASALEGPSMLRSVGVDMSAVSSRVAGIQVGVLLGWMSGRVLGQYDQLLVEDDHPEDQDIVYFVGPNILALEKRYAFPPREFRLWLALHEVTHRAQFTGIDWMRSYFRGLVDSTLRGMDPDPRRLLEALQRTVEQIRRGRNPLDDAGVLGMFASAEQHEAIGRIGGLMSLLEGHGDVTMDRAGAAKIPNADRFSRVLRERRRQAGPARVLATVLGIEAKMRQYEQGEHFIAEIESLGGPALLARAWESSAHLPTLDEIHRPQAWAERVAQVGVGFGS